MLYTEKDLQNWIDKNVENLVSLTLNLDEKIEELTQKISSLNTSEYTDILTTLNSAAEIELNQKLLCSLKAFQMSDSLYSLGTEFPLVNSPLPGKDPSADILAISQCYGSYAIIEVKISANTARQAITELSAYSNGLGGRYWGLSSFDAFWIIINTDYKPTVLEALSYQLLLKNQCIIPLHADVTFEKNEIQNVDLKIIDIPFNNKPHSLNALYSLHTHDAVEIAYKNHLKSNSVLLHNVSTVFSDTGAIGYCFFKTPSEYELNNYPYPNRLFIGFVNPFKLFHKARQLEKYPIKENYLDCLKGQTMDFHDVSLKDFTDIENVEFDIDDENSEVYYLKLLSELSIRDTLSSSVAFDYLYEQLPNILGTKGMELGSPDVSASFRPYMGEANYHESNTYSFRYFGILHYLMMRISAFFIDKKDFEGMSLLEIYESPKLFFNIIYEVN